LRQKIAKGLEALVGGPIHKAKAVDTTKDPQLISMLSSGQITSFNSNSVLAYMLGVGGDTNGTVITPVTGVSFQLSGGVWSLYTAPAPTTITAGQAATTSYSASITTANMDAIHDQLISMLSSGQITSFNSNSVLAYMLGVGGIPTGRLLRQ